MLKTLSIKTVCCVQSTEQPSAWRLCQRDTRRPGLRVCSEASRASWGRRCQPWGRGKQNATLALKVAHCLKGKREPRRLSMNNRIQGAAGAGEILTDFIKEKVLTRLKAHSRRFLLGMPAGAWSRQGCGQNTSQCLGFLTAWVLGPSMGTSTQMPVLSPWRQALGCVQHHVGAQR